MEGCSRDDNPYPHVALVVATSEATSGVDQVACCRAASANSISCMLTSSVSKINYISSIEDTASGIEPGLRAVLVQRSKCQEFTLSSGRTPGFRMNIA